ncbi:MAG: DUF3990 domain-containing protein [Prevotellaceae bacterium]|jgi:hypothetical protein|nr:DUF3990 domain-containing protein [Prevotellaceae bacterium]
MKVYHGSDVEIKVIDLSKAKIGKDFGQGFYVTNILQQAEYMAERVARWNHTKPVVTAFELDQYVFNDPELRILRFDAYDESWLDFVVLNRSNRSDTPAHNYDIVEGPVADDAITIRIQNYMEGSVSKEEFIEELKFKKATHQICFCTDRSLQMLSYVNDENQQRGIYHIDNLIIQQLMYDYNIDDIRAGDLYYDSNTYARFVDKYINKKEQDWKEIYRMLIDEIGSQVDAGTNGCPI